MSDYMFMLESHLSPEQNQVVGWVEEAAGQAGVNAFLSGGAMRDTLGGFPIRDLDFTVEGNPAKLIKLLEKAGAKVEATDDDRRSTAITFPNGVRGQIAQALQLTYAKPGARPQAKPATIHDDLRGRDFTINSIAISLNRASRGLLLDPTNGLSDLERREIRVNTNYTLYDDPSRILRMFRLRARLGFELDPRTQSQYENVREAGLESKITLRDLADELRQMADEPNPLAVLETLDREKLSVLFSPALTGPKINAAGFGKLEKARQAVPYGVDFKSRNLGLFLFLLTEKLTPKERADLISRMSLTKAEVEAWQKLDARAKKLESALKSPKLKKASQVYLLLKAAAGEEVLYLVMFSENRLVKDRLKNHLQKYLITANEVNDKELAHLELEPGSPKFKKAKEDLVLAYLDGRIRKPVPPPEPPPPPPGGPRGPGRPPGRPPAANAPTVVPKAPTAPPPRVAPPPMSARPLSFRAPGSGVQASGGAGAPIVRMAGAGAGLAPAAPARPGMTWMPPVPTPAAPRPQQQQAAAAAAQAGKKTAAPPPGPPAKAAAPAKTAPAKAAPVKTAPAKAVPAKTAPAKAAPAKRSPAKSAPTKKAAKKATPPPTKKSAPVKKSAVKPAASKNAKPQPAKKKAAAAAPAKKKKKK